MSPVTFPNDRTHRSSRSFPMSHVVEIIRFAMYLAVPTASILYFGDPEWYDRYVVPVSIFLSWLYGSSVLTLSMFAMRSTDERSGRITKRHT